MRCLLCLVFCCCLFFSFSSNAQDWRTFMSGDTVYFSGGRIDAQNRNLMRAMWVDSTDASDSRHLYFFHSLRDSLGPGNCIDSLASSWMGPGLMRFADGEEHYFNGLGDTIRIRTKAIPGESWHLLEKNGKTYKATIAQSWVQIIDGIADSIKQASIQAYIGNTPVVDPYNNLFLAWSKDHGWVQTLDFYLFGNPYYSWDAVGAAVDSAQHVRVPSAIKDINLLDLKPHSRYVAGNEWIIKNLFSYWPYSRQTLRHDSVLAVQQISNELLLATIKTVIHETSNEPFSLPVWDSSFTHADSVYAASDTLLVRNNIFPEYNYRLRYLDGAFQANNPHFRRYFMDTGCNSQQLLIQLRSTNSTSPGLIYSGNCLEVSPGLSGNFSEEWDYLQYFGLSYSFIYSSGGQGIASFEESHPYIKTGNCVLGSKFYFGPNSVQEPAIPGSLILYPQPAVDRVYLNENGQKYLMVTICDLSGRVAIRSHRYVEATGIDVSDLTEGVYIVKATSDRAPRVGKLLVRRQ